MSRVGLLVGVLAFGVVLILPAPEGLSEAGKTVLATTVLMAIWWITEAIPIYATALIPLVFFPLGKVLPAAQVSTAYMDRNIVLFMGGFFLATAIQKWGLHRRMALAIIALIGGSLSRLVLGFMLATAAISMWVSNTATAIMMLPIGIAVIAQLRDGGLKAGSPFPTVLMLGIAYSASIGGVATLIGTPPNIVFAGQFTTLFPGREAIGFGQWMAIGLPFAALFLLIAWAFLTRIFANVAKDRFQVITGLIDSERKSLGPLSRGEKGVAAVFILTSLAWIFGRDIHIGALVIPGWITALGLSEYVHDSTVAMISSLILFATPIDLKERDFLLDWTWAVKIPWGILLLFGGGIALAGGFQTTGLARWAGGHLQVFQGLPVPLLIFVICLVVSFSTELTSNTATSAIFMPILAATATTLGLEPKLLMIPATISASCAFMLPIATPPNAIVFGSGQLTIPQMCRAGLWMNLIGAVVTTLVILLIGV